MNFKILELVYCLKLCDLAPLTHFATEGGKGTLGKTNKQKIITYTKNDKIKTEKKTKTGQPK